MGRGWHVSVEIARALKMREADVLCYIAEDKAKSKHSREHVAEHLPRLLPEAGFALALAFGLVINGYMQALPYITKFSGLIDQAIHYAKGLWGILRNSAGSTAQPDGWICFGAR